MSQSWEASENGDMVDQAEYIDPNGDEAVVQEKKIPIKLFVGQIPKIW